MGTEPSKLSKTDSGHVPTSRTIEEENSNRSDKEEVAYRQLGAIASPMSGYAVHAPDPQLSRIDRSVYRSAPALEPQSSGASQTLRFHRMEGNNVWGETAGGGDYSVTELARVLTVDVHEIERNLAFSGSSGTFESRLETESLILANEISHLLTCCGINDRPGRRAIWDVCDGWDLEQPGGDDTLELFGAAAAGKKRKGALDLATAVNGCEFIQKFISLYFIGSDAAPIRSRSFCVKLMGDFLLDPENRYADPAYVADGLRKIKARHLLPLVCVAGELIRRQLLARRSESDLRKSQALRESIDRIPEQFFLSVPPSMCSPDRGLPLEEAVARIAACYREDNREKAINLARHALLLIVGPGVQSFQVGVNRLVERLYMRLIVPDETAISPDEASAWLRRLFIAYFRDNTLIQAAFRDYLEDDRDPVEYLSEGLTNMLKALSETSKARLALAFYQSEFDLLGLDLSFDANLEASQGGNAVVAYNSLAHAGAVLHYVSLIGRIEYFGEELVLPLLRFAAREAQGELPDHRHALRDQVNSIADALEQLGSHYATKVVAIRNWLERNPFG